MKNIPNLYNAMKTVEAACEKGEISIIGEGATPTALEMLGKCVKYIDKMYGGDVMKELLALTEKKHSAPCSCCECCDEDDEYDEVELLSVAVTRDGLYEMVKLELPKGVAEAYTEDIAKRVYDLVVGDECAEEDKDDYLTSLREQLVTNIEDICPFLSEDYVGDIADNITDYIEDHMD